MKMLLSWPNYLENATCLPRLLNVLHCLCAPSTLIYRHTYTNRWMDLWKGPLWCINTTGWDKAKLHDLMTAFTCSMKLYTASVQTLIYQLHESVPILFVNPKRLIGFFTDTIRNYILFFTIFYFLTKIIRNYKNIAHSWWFSCCT